MRFYHQHPGFYCGVDLHATTMYPCILDQAGTILLHHEVPAEPAAFLEAIAPYRDGLVVACECAELRHVGNERFERAANHREMWDFDPRMYAYATGSDLVRLDCTAAR